MIITYLQGGCGNQMFQYTMGLAQCKRVESLMPAYNRHKIELQLDVSRFNGDPMRQYSLDLFAGVQEKLTTGTEATVMEDGMPYNQFVEALIGENSCIRGYWQTEKYFKDYVSQIELRRIFTPKAKLTLQALITLDKIKKSEDRSVFLTVRRTDYVNNTFHGEMDMEYYLSALKIVQEKVIKPLHVFVFSDDPEWCLQNFKIPYEITVGGNFNRTTAEHLGREDEELFLMSCCSHSICANSSYSWWGAYLGEVTGIFQGVTIKPHDRITVAPKKWFGPTSREDSKDIIPERWIKI